MKLIHGDSLDILKEMPDNSVDAVVCDPPYGLKFMGKKWDYEIPSVDLWRECLRVLKPGGHVLIACGTRTQHRMAVNIEDAGFEIRDVITWLYGSGFPKSLNIGKQGGPEGFGTALKPAVEFWTLARKPLSESTVAKNVLKYGTGGINVDGCRVEFQSEQDAKQGRSERITTSKGFQAYAEGEHDKLERSDRSHITGRFPANLILDEEAGALLDEQSGECKSAGTYKITKSTEELNLNGLFPLGYTTNRYAGQAGGASRFFYCAKSSKAERNAGLEGMPELNAYEKDGRKALNIQERIDGSTRTETRNQNHHPTVKPIKLMRYLCRLITPPGGIVLDPFMGSGSTGVAAIQEGFEFIGIEREAEYVEIARRRLTNV